MKLSLVILISGVVFAQDGVTHSVRPAGVTQRVEPEYTDQARAAKLQGTAQLYVELNEQGVPEKVEVLQGLGLGLDAKAIAAVRQWAFRGPQ